MKSLKDNFIDMILADLPYGTTSCKWDDIIPMEPMWEQYNRIAKNNAAMVFFGSQPFTTKLIASNLKNFKYEWIWDKVKPTGHLNAKTRPMKSHENILVFSRGKLNYYPQMVNQKSRVSRNYIKNKTDLFGSEVSVNKIVDKRYPKSILVRSNADQKNRCHPTQKPVDLLEYLIKTYTQPGEIVLDNVMGSGSTGVACRNTNRLFIGIEKNEEYFKIADDRINLTGAHGI